MKTSLSSIIYVILLIIIISCENKNEKISNEEIYCDAETVSRDSSFFMSSRKLNNSSFINGKNQTNKKSHSGQYSVLCNTQSPYGMAYKIDNVLPADSFEINVWRFSKNANGVIVASAEQTDKFYASQKEVSSKDENGWELLTLYVIVPETLKGQTLKIYVWNQDTINEAYFDDLHIKYLNKLKK